MGVSGRLASGAIGAVVLLLSWAGLASAQSPHVSLTVPGGTDTDLLDAGKVVVKAHASSSAKVKISIADAPRGGSKMGPSRSVKLDKGSNSIDMKLGEAGREALDGCAVPKVIATASS